MKKLLIFAFAIIAMCSCTSNGCSRQQSCQNDSDTVVTVDSVDSVQVDSISGFNCLD